MPRRHVGRLALILLVALLGGGEVAAQSQTGTVRGMVLDRNGDPVPGVSIRLENPSRAITELGGVTNEEGQYRVMAVPAGSGYILRVSHPAFQTIEFDDIEVPAGGTFVQHITLWPALTERIRVEGQGEVVETESATTSTTISSAFIAGLPVLGRDYQDVLTLAPGVTDVDNTGNPNIHGARDVDVVTLVDGVNTTDPFTGLYGQELNVESIESIEVITAGATAEFSRAQGGFVNIVTKSGGNEFKGTFKFFMRTDSLDGDGAGIDEAELRGGVGEEDGFRGLDFTDLYPFLALSGPVVRDRLWYYVAPEYSQIGEPINAGSQAFISETRSTRFTGKLTWQVSPDNKLTFTALYDDTVQDNLGLDTRTASESAYSFTRGGPTFTLRDTAVLGPNVSLESTLSRFDQAFRWDPALNPDTNRNGVLFVDDDQSLGGNQDGFINARERDPGEDFDRDGRYDIFEDFNRNGNLDGCTPDPVTGVISCLEDLDHDGRLTAINACEGNDREDINCNGRIDFESDINLNGEVDPAEDQGIPCTNLRLCPGGVIPGTRENGKWDTEDRNGNLLLDTLGESGTTPFPFWNDRNGNGVPEWGEFTSPMSPDRDYVRSLNNNRISGPFFFDYEDTRTRDTFKEDLSIYVDDYFGTHELKLGVVVEQEAFERETHQRPFLQISTRLDLTTGRTGGTVGTFLPTRGRVDNSAQSDHFGFYLQDTYKPLPNLTLGLGLRFDREEVTSNGFTFFEPAVQRQEFDHLMNLNGVEVGGGDLNRDGVITYSLSGDPLYTVTGGSSRVSQLNSALALLAPTRFTRHNFESSPIVSSQLAQFGSEFTNQLLDGLPRQPEEFTITNNNLAPRLSASWDPRADGKSKLFASWGRFYGNLFMQTVVGEQGPDTLSPYYAYDADGVDVQGRPNNQIGGLISRPPPSGFQVDREMRTPFTDEVTLGIEREIAPEVSVSLTYVRRKFRDQLQDVDVNHSVRRPVGNVRCSTTPTGLCDDFGLTIVRPRGGGGEAGKGFTEQRVSDGFPDLYINNFNFNQVFRVGNFNEQDYESYEVHFVRRLSRKWQMDASYVFSEATGQAESFLSESGDDPALTELKDGHLDFDQRHVAKFNAITYLPGDWQLGGSITWTSGLPFSFVNRFQSADNVDFIQTRRLFGAIDVDGFFIDENRNSHRNSSVYDLNLRAQKNFVMGRTSAAAFFEVFNLLNTDDLRVFEIDNRVSRLQSDAVRRFGRRYQFGIQIDF